MTALSGRLRELLDDLEAAGLIRSLEGAEEYRFRHALTREAAYASLTRHRRRQLHLAIGLFLEAHPEASGAEAVDLLAYHFTNAGEPDLACRYALLAADRALSSFSNSEALAFLQQALEVVGPDGSPALRFQLLEALGDVYVLLRKGNRALDRFSAALDAWQAIPAGDQWQGLRLHRKIIHVSVEMKWALEEGTFQALRAAGQASRRALEAASRNLLPEGPTPETVRVQTVLSTAAWRMDRSPDWEAAFRHAQTAVRDGRLLDSPEVLSPALGALAAVTLARGELQESLATALDRLEVTRREGFSDLRERLDSLRGAGAALMYVGNYEEAIVLLLEAEKIAVRIQAVDQQFNVLSLLTQCWFRLDRWDSLLARDADWEELELRFPQEQTGPICFPLALRAVVHARRGEAARAKSLADRSMQIMVSTWGQTNWLRNAHY
ncbi:MAG TPA: hypothetical protein VFI11_02705 [Anaerolineales bacterium]|nr:hypothetical protein [Anaerolineales bacterium]